MRLERRKKYIWGCVLCALLTAVLIGTLIWQALPVKERTDTDVFGK